LELHDRISLGIFDFGLHRLCARIARGSGICSRLAILCHYSIPARSILISGFRVPFSSMTSARLTNNLNTARSLALAVPFLASHWGCPVAAEARVLEYLLLERSNCMGTAP
jgi:hypothetical protein